MLLIIPHNTFYALYGMSNNFLIFTVKDFRAPYVCSHLYLYFERPVNPPGPLLRCQVNWLVDAHLASQLENVGIHNFCFVCGHLLSVLATFKTLQFIWFAHPYICRYPARCGFDVKVVLYPLCNGRSFPSPKRGKQSSLVYDIESMVGTNSYKEEHGNIVICDNDDKNA